MFIDKHLLKTYETFATDCDMVFNYKKTVYMTVYQT